MGVFGEASRFFIDSLNDGLHSMMVDSEIRNALVCPVCEKSSANLYQLNRHLDQVHFEAPEKHKETVKSWLKKRVDEAKYLASIAVSQNNTHKYESFELNENRMDKFEIGREVDVVTRDHWHTETENALCSIVSCQKPLILKVDRINCRKCGKLFCNVHTLYQIKLSKDAQHDPLYGIWSRVCKHCYEERQGYMDTNGPIIDHFAEFKYQRKQAIHKINLYTNRLEKRLSKLTELLTSNLVNEPITNSFFKFIASFKSNKRALEQTVVSWEDDLSVTNCPFCKCSFNYNNRKHHCRLCGKVVCDNIKTRCSSKIQLDMERQYPSSTSLNSKIVHKNSTEDLFHSNISIRICKNCRHIVFSRKEFSNDLLKPHEIVILYRELSSLRHEIEGLLPNFKNNMDELRENNENINQARIDEITSTRKKILETFFQYDKISKDILQLTTKSLTIKNLQTAIHLEANRFLQQNMLSLQFLPVSLKKKNAIDKSKTIRNLSKMSEEKRIQQELQILEEQRLQVQKWVEDANKRRKYDDVRVLLDNFHMLSLEIEKIQTLLKHEES